MLQQDPSIDIDPNKSKKVLSKHGFTLEFASKLFYSQACSFRTEDKDEKYSTYEDRYHSTGFVDGKLITVSYTTRGNNPEHIRLITAWPASAAEEERYWKEALNKR